MAASTLSVQEAVPAGTARSSVLTLINSAVGAGVLSFPFVYRCTGWAAGLAATFCIASVEAFTLYVLARYAEYTRTNTYASLVRKMLGGPASLLMSLIMLGYPFGSCIAYLVITGDSFQPLLVELFGATWFTSRTAIIVGVGCFIILPLCFRTRLGALAAVSQVCVYGLMVVVAVIVLRSAQIVGGAGYSWGPVRAVQPLSIQFFSALIIVVFGFHCHTNVITVFDELEPQPVLFFRPGSDASLDATPGPAAGTASPAEHPAQHRVAEAAPAAGPAAPTGGGKREPRPKTVKLLGMIQVVIAALFVTGLGYSCVGLAGYLAFPSSAHSDIMLNFSPDDLLMQVARAAVGCIQLAAYPINHFPARGAIRDLLLQATGRSFAGPGFVAAETLCFFGTTLAIALWCSDLGSILKLVGGTCGNALIFVFPGGLLVEYAHSKQRESRRRLAEHRALHEPLLPEAAEAGGEAAQAVQAAPVQPYSMWASKLFWAGVLLLAVSLGVGTLTIYTTLHPLPPP